MRLPSNRSARTRFGFGAAAFAVAAGLVLAATPAMAEPAGADVEFKVLGDKIVQLASKPFYVNLVNHGPGTAEGIAIKVDVGGLDTAKLQVEPPVGRCDVDGTIFTCRYGSLIPGEHENGFSPFTINSIETEGPAQGPAGSFTVEVISETPDPNPDNNKKITVPVGIEPVGYDLVAYVQDVWATPAAEERITPGATAPLVFFFANNGAATAEGIIWKVSLPPFVTFPEAEKHDFCAYNDTRTEATCKLPDEKVDPGLAFNLDEKHAPMLVQVAKDAPGPVALARGIVDGGGIRQGAPPPAGLAPRQGAKAAAKGVVIAEPTSEQKRQIEADPEDNLAEFSVHTATNPANLSVTGGSASGAVGATVTITVTVKNDGPASSPFTTLVVTAPSGTELVNMPNGCQFEIAGRVGKCEGMLEAGEVDSEPFAFKILSGTVGTDGKAVISGSLDDPVEANNTAAITITVEGGLPITGTKVSLIGGVGLAVLATGIVLYVMARRRRVVLVTPEQDA